MDIKWKAVVKRMPDGNLVWVDARSLLWIAGFSLAEAAKMPHKTPISLGAAAALFYDELYDKVQLDLRQEDFLEQSYSRNLCQWISALGFHIEPNEADFECEYSSLSH